MFGRRSFIRGFNRGQADGIAATSSLVKAVVLPLIESRLDSDASELRALKAENALLKCQIEELQRANAAKVEAPVELGEERQKQNE